MENVKSRAKEKWLVIAVFMFVPLLLLLVFTYVPFFKMVQFSFYKMKYVGARKFVGLDNYRALFARKDIVSSLKLCLY